MFLIIESSGGKISITASFSITAGKLREVLQGIKRATNNTQNRLKDLIEVLLTVIDLRNPHHLFTSL